MAGRVIPFTSLKIALVLTLLLALGGRALADWPYCLSHCHGQGVRVDRVYLEDVHQVGAQLVADVYVDFTVQGGRRYCILVALDLGLGDGCGSPQTIYRGFGHRAAGAYLHQRVGTVTWPVGEELWVCRSYAQWRNRRTPVCVEGFCPFYWVGSGCWEDQGVPYPLFYPTLKVEVWGLSSLEVDQEFIALGRRYGSLGTLHVTVWSSVEYQVVASYTVSPAPSPSFTGDPLSLEYPAGVWTTIPHAPGTTDLPGFSGQPTPPGGETHAYPVRVDLALLGDRRAGEEFTFTIHVAVSESGL